MHRNHLTPRAWPESNALPPEWNTPSKAFSLSHAVDQTVDTAQFSEEITALTEEFHENAGDQTTLETEITWEPREPLAARLIVLALATLLRNITDHANASRVTITISNESLTITDDGVGIPDLPAIHEALTRGHPLPSGGLGLSIVERICRRMNWTFSTENLTPSGLQSKIRF